MFGHFCTGVTVITTAGPAGPAGFACQAFAPLSLQPPLVLFCPQRDSRTWRRIRASGVFGVNVLAEEHRDLSRVFGSRAADRFTDGVRWTPAPSGAPILTDALTWADCRVEAVHPGGDHAIVVGRVTALGECRDATPLLFYRGGYTVTAADRPPWPRDDDWM